MQLRSLVRHGCFLPPVAPSPRTSARNATSSRSEVTCAIFPDATCSIRPTTRSEGRACASRCSTNARSGDSSSGAEFSAVRRADRGVFRVLATEATIRPPAITHDGTEVRLRLEGGKQAVRPRGDGRRSTPDVRWLCPGPRQRAARVRRRGGRAHAEAVRGPARLLEDGGQLVTRDSCFENHLRTPRRPPAPQTPWSGLHCAEAGPLFLPESAPGHPSIVSGSAAASILGRWPQSR